MIKLSTISQQILALGLPLAPEVGPQAPLLYLGGDLGLGNKTVSITAGSQEYGRPMRYVQMKLEHALRQIDLFCEPGRSRILVGVEIHFGLSELEGGAA